MPATETLSETAQEILTLTPASVEHPTEWQLYEENLSRVLELSHALHHQVTDLLSELHINDQFFPEASDLIQARLAQYKNAWGAFEGWSDCHPCIQQKLNTMMFARLAAMHALGVLLKLELSQQPRMRYEGDVLHFTAGSMPQPSLN